MLSICSPRHNTPVKALMKRIGDGYRMKPAAAAHPMTLFHGRQAKMAEYVHPVSSERFTSKVTCTFKVPLCKLFENLLVEYDCTKLTQSKHTHACHSLGHSICMCTVYLVCLRTTM